MVEQLRLDDLQSYGELFASPKPREAKGEQRQSGRKMFEADAVLTMDGNTFDIKTVDISAGGLCIRATKQLAVGKDGRVAFQITVDGAARSVDAGVQVIYCFFTGDQHFKLGLEFLGIGAASADEIRRFVAG